MPKTSPRSTAPRFEDVQDVLRYHLNRRNLLAGGSAIAAGGLLNACTGGGGGSYTDRNKGAGKPKQQAELNVSKANIPTPREKTVIIAQSDFTVFNNWNTMVPNGAPTGSGFDTLVKDYMFYLNLATGQLIPWLCTDYKYNDDFTELTFHFDPKAKWSDGKPLTSEDFKFTVDLFRSRKDLLGDTGASADLNDFVTSVSVPDPQTAVLVLNKPNPRMHYGFIAVILRGFDIRPKHIWANQDPTKFRDNPPVRSGPYLLDQAIQSQKMFVWKKNPDYWNKAKLDVRPDYVVYQSTAKQVDSAALAFERAQFDVGSIDEEHAKQLRAQGYPALVTTQFHDPCPRAFWLNNDPKRGIIAEPKMHWVINYLVDRAKDGNNVWPVKTPAAHYPWADYPSNKKWEDQTVASKYPFVYDPAKAEDLLDEIAPKGAGGKRMYKGKKASIEIITPVAVDGAEYVMGKLVRDQLVKLGVDATIRSLTGSVHDEKVQRGEFDITSNWVCDVSWDPEQLYSNLQSDKAVPIGKNAVSRNQTRLRDKRLDKLSKQLANMDPTSNQAKNLFAQALEIYYQDLPVIPLIQTGYPQYFNTAFWKGWPTDDNLYQVPLNWWGHFIFVFGKIEPTGRKAPA